MPKFKKTIKVSCFHVAWLALFFSYQLDLASAHKLKLAKTDANQKNLTMRYSQLNQQPQSGTNLLVAADLKATSTNVDQPQLQSIKLFSPSFFLILFTSCGIFYPLFLFYRKLLETEHKELNYTWHKPNQPNKLVEHNNQKRADILVGVSANAGSTSTKQSGGIPVDNTGESEGFTSQSLDSPPLGRRDVERVGWQENFANMQLMPSSNRRSGDKLQPDNFRTGDRSLRSSIETPTKAKNATVSKLQIAFSPQALRLRQKLSQISCSADSNQEQDIVDLLYKTVLALVSYQNWTHVNHSSMALTLAEAKAEFDLISQTERKKCLTKELSLAKHNHSKNYDFSEQQDYYRYVVVTLILWTTHNSPLFTKIHTEEQLIGELGKLSRMRREDLLKLELLWNPQQEAIYLNNEQLLTEYSELNRLL